MRVRKFGPNDILSLSAEKVEWFKNQPLFVVEVKPRAKYVNGKRIANEFTGLTFTLEFDHGSEFAGSRLRVTDEKKVNLAITPSEQLADYYLDQRVVLVLERIKVYSRITRPGFSQVEVSYYGQILVPSTENEGVG